MKIEEAFKKDRRGERTIRDEQKDERKRLTKGKGKKEGQERRTGQSGCGTKDENEVDRDAGPKVLMYAKSRMGLHGWMRTEKEEEGPGQAQ